MRHFSIIPTWAIQCAALGALCLLHTGCSVLKPTADNTKFYVLRAVPGTPVSVPDAAADKPTVRVGMARVAAYLDVTPIVTQNGSNQVMQLDLHHWAEPFPKGISRVFSEDLAQRLGGARIIVHPEPVDGAQLEVRYSIHQCEGPLAGPMRLSVTWQVVDLASGDVLHAATTTREIADANHLKDVSSYTGRISTAVGLWADEVAASVRSLLVDENQ